MFKFNGILDRKRFLWAAAIRVGLFLASVFGFPFFLMALAEVSGCRGIGGACGAVGLVGAMAYKPLVFVIFVFSFIGVSMRRARDAGAPAWTGLLIPLLLAADHRFLIFAGAPWSFAFSAGVMSGGFPRAAVFALYAMAILSLMPSRPAGGAGNPFGVAGWLALALGLFLSCFLLLGVASGFSGLGWLVLPIAMALRPVAMLSPYAMVALGVVLAWIAWQELRRPAAEVSRGEAMPAAPEVAAQPGLPVAALLLVATVPTVLAFVVGTQSQMTASLLPIAFATSLTPILLPTLMIYFVVLLAAWLALTRRTLISAGALVLALSPFVHWGYAHWTASQQHRKEAAEIAAIPTMRPAGMPSTIVFESQHTTGMHAAWKVPGIQRVISKGAYGQRLVQFERAERRGQPLRQTAVSELPPDYLLLRVGRQSSFAAKGQIYGTAGGPLELRLVGAGRDDLIAVWYQKFNPAPSVLPLLTTAGWFRGSNSATTDQVSDVIVTFLNKALAASG